MFLVEVLLIFVVLYPVVTSMMWVPAGSCFASWRSRTGGPQNRLSGRESPC